MGRPKSARFSLMTDGELLAHCRTLYEAEGPAALTFKALKAVGVYYPLYQRGIRQADLIAHLGIGDTYKTHKSAQPLQRNGKTVRRWSWDRRFS